MRSVAQKLIGCLLALAFLSTLLFIDHAKASENADTYSGIKASEYINEFYYIPESTLEYDATGYYGDMDAQVVKVYLDTPIASRSYIYNMVNPALNANNGYLLIDARDVEAFIAYFGRTNNTEYTQHVKGELDNKGAKVYLRQGITTYEFYSFAEVAQAAGGSPGQANRVSRGTKPATYELRLSDYHVYEDRYPHQMGINLPSQAMEDEPINIEFTVTDGSYYIIKPQTWLITVSGPNGSSTLMDYTQVYLSGHSHKETLTYTFSDPGTYQVKFSIISDASYHNNNRTGTNRYSVTRSITIIPKDGPYEPGGPVAQFTWSPTTGVAGEPIQFTDQSYHPDGLKIVSWEWRHAGNLISTAQHPNYTFNSSGTYTVILTVTDENGKSDAAAHSITVAAGAPKHPPTACINAPASVVAGNPVMVSSCSWDSDGEIVQLEWTWDGKGTPLAPGQLETNDESGTIIFLQPGIRKVMLRVTDNDGLTGFAEKDINVGVPVPVPIMTVEGTLKENRKVILDASLSIGTQAYPIDGKLTTWEITPLDGQAEASIKFKNNSNTGHYKEVLFKEPGRYNVKMTIYNTYGNSSHTSRVITIAEDLPPVAEFTMPAKVFRDPNNHNKALFILRDQSYSPDGDIITQRIWRYLYDSQNDGRLDNDTWITVSSTNQTEVKIEVSQVGNYYFQLEVVESFGQETIPEFITSSDYKRSVDE